MLLGIDVGGTHTDAVIIDKSGVKASSKTETDPENLISSLEKALGQLLQKNDARGIKKINLSTTLTTNAIVEKKLEEVAVLAVAGPGLPSEFLSRGLGGHFHLLPGSIDHRGACRQALDQSAARSALAECREQGVRNYALVSKFSTRNPDIETELEQMAGPQADFITLGHQVSGRLNFPRRLATAYYNAAVWRSYNDFADAATATMSRFDLKAPLNILKADGGTIDFTNSRKNPVQTILSGPAASVMGIVALNRIDEDAIILDIGGTTTDIAIFADGAPLLEKNGVDFAGRPTLVRAIATHSIGIGGDSQVTLRENGAIQVGPQRQGPPMALGGALPTLIDALNVKGNCQLGKVELSRQGLEQLARNSECKAVDIAAGAIDYALNRIRRECDAILTEINRKPVYTVAEILHNRKIKPRQLHVMGGPAAIMGPLLSRVFELEARVPKNYAIANAIGAALTRTTMEIELFADTGRQTMLIPNLNIRRQIGSAYTLEKAQNEAITELSGFLKRNGHPEIAPEQVSVIEAETFNMVDDFSISSRSIRVNCQIRPDLEGAYLKEVREHD